MWLGICLVDNFGKGVLNVHSAKMYDAEVGVFFIFIFLMQFISSLPFNKVKKNRNGNNYFYVSLIG